MLCDYGCGKEATHKFKNGKLCCCTDFRSCKGLNNKKSNSSKGRYVWNKGKDNCFSKETIIKMRNSKVGKKRTI
jgi:hypothetical protein